MILLSNELKNRFAEVGSQENIKDPIVIAKFFHPLSSRTWFATEYDPKTNEFFWRVKWDFPELWYFSLEELQSINIQWLWMECDLFREEKPLSEVMKEYD